MPGGGPMPNCCLCLDLRAERRTDIWNTPLLESENFLAIPSLGSLVPGWVLLLPKDHYLSMGALPSYLVGEMMEVKQELASRLSETFGDLCAFEHGASRTKRNVGCGVDHAHLHVVPINFELRRAAQRFLPSGQRWSSGNLDDCRKAYAEGRDYLYLEQPLGSGSIAVDDDFGSQVFRRAIANELGMSDEYNWREHPQFPNIVSTVRTLQYGHTAALIGQPEVGSIP